MPSPTSRDGGQAALLLVALVAGVTLAVPALAGVIGDAIDQAAAQHAADAAALAAVDGGSAEAGRVAEASGGALVSVREVGGDVLVVVRVGDQVATARASARP